MPRIFEYQQQVGAPGEINSRRAQAGDSFTFPSEVGQAIGVVNEAISRQEVSDVHAKLAKARAEWTVHLAERANSTSPGDSSFAGKFSEDFGQYIESIDGQFQTKAGQQAFRQGSSELASHFTERAGLYQAQAMGQKAKQDYTVTLDSYRNILLSDPTQFSQVEKSAMDALHDLNGLYTKMPAADREQLVIQTRQQLALSSIQGLIQNGAPELAKRQLVDGQWDSYLDADSKNTLLNSADTGIRGKDADIKHQKELAKEAEKQRIDQINTQLNDKFMMHKLTWNDVKNAGLPADGPGSQDHWITRIKQQTKDLQETPAKTNPAIFNDIRERISLPYGNPRKIDNTDAIWKFYGNGLSEADANRLERRLVDDKTDTGQKYSSAEKEFLNNMRPQLDKTTLFMPDEEGGGRMQAFSTYVRDKADEMKKAGKDPRDLFNPNSPDYAGNAVKMFQTAPQIRGAEIMRRMNEGMGQPAKRKSLDEIFK